MRTADMDRERERRQWESQQDHVREPDERKRQYKEVWRSMYHLPACWS